ncbi:transposase [uncultured Pseudonocardia sp.]|uniref:transposase n=1 Tax=uncultured Pseudonocardia sp. TaxID=211455 RepID=UPI00345C602C
MEPRVPDRAPRRGGQWREYRQVLEGIAWRFRTGSPWRELPDRFGPWQPAYERHHRWGSDGTRARLLAEAQTCSDVAGELDWIVAADSSLVRCTSEECPQRGSAGTPPRWSGQCGSQGHGRITRNSAVNPSAAGPNRSSWSPRITRSVGRGAG